jgi:hypothetical protein
MTRAAAVALALPLVACTALREQAPGHLQVRSAALRADAGGVELALDLDCALSGPMRDALDHGIPIAFKVELKAGGSLLHAPEATARRRITLRYYPLSRRYQVLGQDGPGASARSFAAPAYLVDALGTLHIALPPAFAALPAGTPLRLRVGIDPAVLPGPLRVPALFEPAWQLRAAEYRWPSAG